jgi:hypothetical protein
MEMNPTQEQLYKIENVLKTIVKTMVEKYYCPRYLGLKDGCINYPDETKIKRCTECWCNVLGLERIK